MVEEAQSVLNENSSAAAPYVEWVKEGRKYDLGAVLITQQPGSIPPEILSQGDNWFLFHLLSAADLQNVKKANAHFSDDILSALLNEPIPGQGVFWSSVSGMSYPIPMRVLSFERMYERLDATYTSPAVDAYAARLRGAFSSKLEQVIPTPSDAVSEAVFSSDRTSTGEASVDVLRALQQHAIEALRNSEEFKKSIQGNGIPWGKVFGILRDALPPTMDNRDNSAYSLIPGALTAIFGAQGQGWFTERRGPKSTLFVVKK